MKQKRKFIILFKVKFQKESLYFYCLVKLKFAKKYFMKKLDDKNVNTSWRLVKKKSNYIIPNEDLKIFGLN